MFAYKKRFAVLALVAYILTALVIFALSLQSGDGSGKLSQAVYAFLAGINVSHEKIETDVERVDISSIAIKANSSVFCVGQSVTLKTDVLPSAHTEELTFYSSNESVATVNQNGKVTFLSVGTVNVYAVNKGQTAVSNVLSFMVYDVSDISSLDLEKLKIVIADELPTNTAKAIGLTYDDEPVYFNYKLVSTNESVAETKGVYVITRGEGQTTLQLTLGDEVVSSKQLTVTGEVLEEPLIVSAKLDGEPCKDLSKVYLGKSYELTFELSNEENATKSYIIYAHYDEQSGRSPVKISYAKSGARVVVQGTACGSATLAVCSRTRYEDEVFFFNVEVLPPPALAVAINKPEGGYQVGIAYSPELIVADDYATVGYDFTVSGKDYSKNGKTVTFNAAGEYKVTFTSIYYPEYEYSFTLLVFDGEAEGAVRKGVGHFGLFAALGFLGVFWAFSFIKKPVYSAIIDLVSGLGVATMSEIFQLSFFTAARGFSPLDILLDLGGYALGSAIALALTFIVYKIVSSRRVSSPKVE